MPHTGKGGAGSPPRAWGGRPSTQRGSSARRLTPTCVGRTALPWPGPGKIPAHPHVRGEDRSAAFSPSLVSGSPPRAWGGRGGDGERHDPRRLTPTCVGRTASGWTTSSHGPAHPHVRGEDHRGRDGPRAAVGSPPRAWGGRRRRSSRRRGSRLTPTCVGRTRAPVRPPRTPAAHPHVRGEDKRPGLRRRNGGGSPPRAWGGRIRRRYEPVTCGSPHVRGEDCPSSWRRRSARGSPPRAWGGREGVWGKGKPLRLTPTCVGRT